MSALKEVDIEVPLRTGGRKSHHTETWTLSRLLATLATAGRLQFPLSAISRDRPDSLMTSGSLRVGIEITEAISPQYAAYSALAEREAPNLLLEPGHFRWGAREMSVAEMRQLLRQSQLSSPPWAGDKAEHEWALFIQSTVDTKLEKLTRPGFETFDRNWLAIYDNLPMPHMELDRAIAHLRPLLHDRWCRVPGFDRIYIEHGPVIAEVRRTGSEHLILNDLWR